MMPTITTMDELVSYAYLLTEGKAELEPVTIEAEKLIVPLEIDGEGWDKRITTTHAKYILDLQGKLDALIDQYAPDVRDREEQPMVRAEVKDGSCEILQDLKEIITPLVSNMTDTQSFVAVMTAIIGTCGYLAWSRWAKYRSEHDDRETELQQLTAHEETKRQMLQPFLEKANSDPENYSHLEQPLKRLYKTLGEDDAIALVGEGYIPAKDVSKIKPPRAKRTEKKSVACDGEYQLIKADYSRGEYILHLFKDGVPLKAYTSALDDDDQKKLTQLIADKTNEEESYPFAISIQVTVEYTTKGILRGDIVGLGAPRPEKDIKLLSDLTG